MSDLSAPLFKWFSERPKWLQLAAISLLEQHSIDISGLSIMCQLEAKGQLVNSDYTFPANAFDADSSAPCVSQIISPVSFMPTCPAYVGLNVGG